MRELDEPTILQKINCRRISKYNSIIKNRVFDHNMLHGLCYNNFRNFYWELYFRRESYKNIK